MADHIPMPVHEQWSCGHTATAMCSECYQELAERANKLQARIEEMHEHTTRDQSLIADLLRENKQLREEIALVSK